jgi:hypothetical protein
VTAVRRGTLGGLTIVGVNNPAQHIAPSDWPGLDGWEGNGRVLLDTLVGARRVVVLHIFEKDTSQVALTENEQMVKAFLED